MTHQPKSNMHPADIEAMNDRKEWLTDEFKEALSNAILHKTMNARLNEADPCNLDKFASALTDLAQAARRLDKHEAEMKKAGL